MEFDEFKQNVQRWATERGIYEHSTPTAQALKAVSEMGETADAVIKDERDKLKDGIGDTVVCLVNLARMTGVEINHRHNYSMEPATHVAAAASAMVGLAALNTVEPMQRLHLSLAIGSAMEALDVLAQAVELDFMDCCYAAWQEIKDRKGRMVAGGAFVKE